MSRSTTPSSSTSQINFSESPPNSRTRIYPFHVVNPRILDTCKNIEVIGGVQSQPRTTNEMNTNPRTIHTRLLISGLNKQVGIIANLALSVTDNKERSISFVESLCTGRTNGVGSSTNDFLSSAGDSIRATSNRFLFVLSLFNQGRGDLEITVVRAYVLDR